MKEPAVPETLLFDLGGVLMEFAAFEELPKLFARPPGPSEIRAKWLGSAAVRDFELGRIDAEEFGRRFVAEWDLERTPGEFLEEFESWLRGFYPGVPELLAALRGRFRTACLSNTNPIHWSIFGERVLASVGAAFLSFQNRLAKPDPAFFEAAVARLGLEPARALFFDDSEANVDAARETGLEAELVRGAGELAQALSRRGLVDPGPAGTRPRATGRA